MLISHKIALDPNNKQATHFARAAGVARFAYNWALAEWKRQYEEWRADSTKPKPSWPSLNRQLNAIKRENFPWMLEVTKCAPATAIMRLGRAFQNFFDGRARYPKFRKKGVHDRFDINDCFRIDGRRIRIQRLGWVRMREHLRFEGKIMSATVSRVADKWFISITVDCPNPRLPQAENQGTVGVDLGVSHLATLSTGEKVEGPKPHKHLLARIRRLSRSLSRKVKGSRNRQKARMKLAKLHNRVTNIRKDALHKLTSDVTRRFHTIGIEDLNVRGMLQNRHLSRAVADMGFYEFKWQVEYKATMRGGLVVVADKWFASSKLCHQCGHKVEALTLATRSWSCPECGTHHDRDVNAAINLKNYAVGATVSACGEEGSGFGRKPKVKPASMKQEISTKSINRRFRYV
jgi:putative transposase